MATRWQRILRDPATRFGAALYFSLALHLVQGIWLMRLLDPVDYGRWIELMLIVIYGQHFHLGIHQSVLRQLPLLRGQKEGVRAIEITGTAHASLLALSVVWLGVGMTAVPFLYSEMPRFAFVAVGVTVMEAWSALAEAELKTEERFGRVGLLTVLRSSLNLSLLVLVARYGLEGAVLRWVILGVTMTLLWWTFNPLRARFRFCWKDFRFLLHDGGPILLIGVLFAMQVSMDKTLIKAFLDPEAMGRYGAAAVLMTLMMIIPTSIGQTAYPRMLEAFGRGATPAELFSHVGHRCLWVGGLSVVVASVGGMLMPTVLQWLLPKYLVGVHAAQWLLPGTVFLSTSVPVTYYLQTIRRQRLHAAVSGGGVLTQILLGSIVLRQGGDIEELAMTTSASLLIYLLALLLAARVVSRRPVLQ